MFKIIIAAILFLFKSHLIWAIPIGIWYFWPSDDKAMQIANLKNEVRLKDARLVSNRRQIERRDAAIKASNCSKEIEFWVRNPDHVPTKFDPFTNSPLGR